MVDTESPKTEVTSGRDRLMEVLVAWMGNLDAYPGWREWKRKHVSHTLHFDDDLYRPEKPEPEFVFSADISKQHAVALQYLGLLESVKLLKECEYYFRRFPFRGLPVSHHTHLTNACEMYFNRFYEFRERCKKYCEALNLAARGRRLDVGAVIKLFDKTFERELRKRHSTHHRERFSDVAIDRLLLTQTMSETNPAGGWDREHTIAYRKLAREWALRVRQRGEELDVFLEGIALVTLQSGAFPNPIESNRAA